jgi:pimeloyl-ACP methyl ester carboxylesterase
MKNKFTVCGLLVFSAIFCTQILITPTASAGKPSGSAYKDGKTNTHALILCHGRGKDPRWKVVDPLRKEVHKKLGWHTLSLQMPADDKNWKKYADDFPSAYTSIKQGISFLIREKGVKTIYLMGHSMGSRMAAAFVAEHPDQPISGLIVAGIRNNGGYPLNGLESLMNVKIPVLDIWGGDDNKDARHAEDRETLVSATYMQVSVSGANHKFEGNENEFLKQVVQWLKKLQ